MSPSSAWRVCITRGSTAEASVMWAARVQSMIQTNIALGNRVTSELSSVVSGQRLGH